MFKTIKKVWRYVRKYKKTLYLAIFFMVCIQILNLFSPLIVKSIFDDHLVKIQNVYYEANTGILYNDKYYNQKDVNDKGIRIFNLDKKYYLVEELIPIEYNNVALENDKLVIYNKMHEKIIKDYKILSKNEIKLFYSPSFKPLIILFILVTLKFILQILFSYFQKISISKMNISVVIDARNDMVKSLQKMPMKYFDEEQSGKIANRVLTDVGGMVSIFGTLMNLLLNASMTVVFTYIGMFYLNFKLAILSFIIFPIVYIWFKFFMKRLNKIAVNTNEQASLLTAELNEVISGINILQIYNYEKETLDKFNNISNNYHKERMKEARLHIFLGWNMIKLIGGLITALVVFYFANGYVNILGFSASAGIIYAYITYLTGIIDPIQILFSEIGNLKHSLVRCERVFKIIDAKKDEPQKIEDKGLEVKGNIKFDNVNFAYNEDKQILKNLNFEIKENSVVAIVGATGSGKSTILNLILRFYDLKDKNSGKILLDGVDINTYSKKEYRKNIKIILQEPILFSGSIIDNIKFGSKISDDAALEILKEVGGEDLIDKFNDEENKIKKNRNLSVGQRQIISFARVLASNPKILILDEATANIDSQTESKIQKALEKVRKNRTVIIIAHRLATIKNADKIIVLDKGQKVEEGRHQELLENNFIYSNMYRAQIK